MRWSGIHEQKVCLGLRKTLGKGVSWREDASWIRTRGGREEIVVTIGVYRFSRVVYQIVVV